MRVFLILYEIVMTGLALAVLWLITLPEEELWVRQTNFTIWVIFAGDYIVRLYLARGRRRFVRKNIPDLIAAIPLEYILDFLLGQDLFGFERLFRLVRFARFIRLFRAGIILWRVSCNIRSILKHNGLGYVLLVTSSVVVLGGVGVWLVEPKIETVGDGIWWSLVTTTTVGYGDIAPSTTIGRIVAAVLMLVGIGTISLITSTMASYFIGKRGSANSNIQHIIIELERWEELSRDERYQIAAMMKALAETSSEPEDPLSKEKRGYRSDQGG